jgi:hypothetical protein
VRAARLLRIARSRSFLKEFVVGVAAGVAVVALHQWLLARLRLARPLESPGPALLARVIPQLDAGGTPAEALKRVARAAHVSLVVRPEGFDPDAPRESHSPGDLQDGVWRRIPPPTLDVRLRNVTLGQALHVVGELSPYGFRITDCHDDSVTLAFGGDDEVPPVVRMYDLGRLNGEAARFALTFSRAAFGTDAAATASKKDLMTRWSAAQLWRVLDRQLPGPPVVTDNRAVGDCWFLRADPEFQDGMDAFLAVLEDPEARAGGGGDRESSDAKGGAR